MKFKLFKIKPGKLDVWQDWCHYLKTQEAEVLETLKEENAVREINLLLPGSFILYGMEFIDTPIPSNKDKALNRTHKEKLQECLEEVELVTLFDFHV